mmetsp:Transcript_36635/g.68159  ORF Transcript_36635/g.68159 Transcript_36635/m.68159 type:complete len:582 (-) Transcript_36635:129-1874(-)|eukprot:CAMPEP_0114413450 /NCGR_PEP_ID=MMETSP0103-20121206/861_1 /TAXON_ID=37642 ORGANISM="Paraphysomonas imperforata, Strain PA2" /NCGR_SAMPLE_ID=MMETSP0103 /ASSEMBLY_ACC=CAM_ASM_000201 /LENGTH=581 /DNA_ID=CAMNT_0001581525 /DNA_START=84 /DNA_END=1829 /DNA_ORIENTATION=+
MPTVGFLTGCLICTTGGTSSEEKLVQKLALQHGGKFSRNFDPKKVTHLIVHKVGSKKHEMAIQQKIWDLSLDWLISSNESDTRMDEVKFRVGPFKGLNISVTQLNLEERHEVARVVEAGGGVFSSDLCQETCTHLIAQEPSGDKYNAARSWGGIWLVTPEWIHDCDAHSVWRSEKRYPVLAEIRLPPASTIPQQSGKSQPRTDQSTTGRNVTAADTASGATLVDSEVLSAPEVVEEVLIGTEHEQDHALLTLAIPISITDSSCKFENCQQPRQFQSFMSAHYGQGVQTSGMRQQPLFNEKALHGEVLFVSGFSSQVEVLVRQLIIIGGGMRHQMLTEQVSIALVGSDSSDRLKRSVLLHPMKPLPLTLSWLLSVTVVGWSPPSVHDINQRIELNRDLEQQRKAAAQADVSNSFSNYKLFFPEKSQAEGDVEDESNPDEEMFEEFDSNHSRSSPRAVVMTWKQRETHNSKLTAKLVAQKRSRHQHENDVPDGGNYANGSTSIQPQAQADNIDATPSHRKRRKGVIFKKNLSPAGESQLSNAPSFTKRRSSRLIVENSSFPPGESQVAILASLEPDTGDNDDW